MNDLLYPKIGDIVEFEELDPFSGLWEKSQGMVTDIHATLRYGKVVHSYSIQGPYPLIAQERICRIVKSASYGFECECGKDKHGFAGHTHWCPKFNSNFKT